MRFRILPLLATLLTFHFAYAQPEIVLTFTGSFNSKYVPLDSVRITNLTQGGDTTIYGADTVLRLEYNTGIGEWGSQGDDVYLRPAHPNPFKNHSDFEVYLPQQQSVTLKVTDAAGRLLAGYEGEVERGWQAFRFSSDVKGSFFLSLSAESGAKVLKLICEGSHSGGGSSISYLGQLGERIGTKEVAAGFPYNLGDALYFLGFAGSDRDTLADTPTTDQDYSFVFQAGGFPCPGAHSVSYGGKNYMTIQISQQCWLSENLDVGQYISADNNMTDNEIIEKYCYGNDEGNCETYGGLYQWNEVMQYVSTSGSQGICPDGWHIPTDAEWVTLMNHLGGDRNAGGLMKEEGTAHWDAPNTDATNASGFTALPGGFSEGSSVFAGMGQYAFFWTSDTFGLILSTGYELRHNSANLFTENHVRTRGFSVRCLKD